MNTTKLDTTTLEFRVDVALSCSGDPTDREVILIVAEAHEEEVEKMFKVSNSCWDCHAGTDLSTGGPCSRMTNGVHGPRW